MEYMTVTARMREPVVHYEDGMHLDGILAYAAFRIYQREGGAPLPPINEAWCLDFDLPLTRWVRPLPVGCDVDQRLLIDGEVWGFCASRVNADWLARGKMEYRKRPDLDRMRRYTQAKSHSLGAGALKAFDVAYPTMTARELHWMAQGDIDAVRAHLALVSHIGKKCATGMGAVGEWLVEPCNAQAIKRRLPVDGGMSGSIRPPYHHISRHVSADWGEV